MISTIKIIHSDDYNLKIMDDPDFPEECVRIGEEGAGFTNVLMSISKKDIPEFIEALKTFQLDDL